MRNQIARFALAAFFFFDASVYAQVSFELPAGSVAPVERSLARDPRLLSAPLVPQKSDPQPLVIGYPLIQTKGIVKGDGVLYIADTGKDSKHTEAAKIWKFEPNSRKLELLYQGQMLVNAKWLFYRTTGSGGELFVSDYGKEVAPRVAGTGEGAKVFVIPLDKTGNALEPRIIHSGPPLRSPEGITVIGESIILADWAAGDEVSLPDRPGKFRSGAVFVLPTSGGAPQKVFESHKWVTVIGSCQYIGEDGRLYIRFIDLDSGRPDTSALRYLPQSGTVEFFRTQVLNESPLKLGDLQRIVIREQIPVSIEIGGSKAGDRYLVKDLVGANINSSRGSVKNGRVEFSVGSDTSAEVIKFSLQIARGQIKLGERSFEIPKELGEATMRDNKHGAKMSDGVINLPRLVATADGTTKGVYLLPPNGGIPSTLWRGAPFEQPMGVQYSWTGTKIWVTDQDAGPDGTAAIFEINLPTERRLLNEFPQLRGQKWIQPK